MPVTEMPIDDYIKSGSPSISSGSLDQDLLSLSSLSNQSDEGIVAQRSALYEPILLPKEPTIDELLRNIASTSDLATIPEVQLKVSSNMFGLQRLNIFLPSLIALNLDGSELHSLRDLGVNLNLKFLNVSRCGLRNFDGTNGLSTLQVLIADGNFINNVQPLCNLSELKILSLRGNKIDDMCTLSFLALCEDLKEIDLTSNPITKREEYREYISLRIPQIQLLDGRPVVAINTMDSMDMGILSSSEYSASIASSQSTTSNEIPGNILMPKRPASCDATKELIDENDELNDSIFEGELHKRTNSLSMGEPISGNIILKARRQRGKKVKTAWMDSDSTSTSTSTNSINNIPTIMVEKTFPKTLPQLNVELELGIVGVPNRQQTDVTDDECDIETLLAAARQWRQKARKF